MMRVPPKNYLLPRQNHQIFLYHDPTIHYIEESVTLFHSIFYYTIIDHMVGGNRFLASFLELHPLSEREKDSILENGRMGFEGVYFSSQRCGVHFFFIVRRSEKLLLPFFFFMKLILRLGVLRPLSTLVAVSFEVENE